MAANWQSGLHMEIMRFIVATHTNTSSAIHSHIIFSAVNLDCDRKFRDFLGSGRALGRLSDTLCVENGLSIIEKPQHTTLDL